MNEKDCRRNILLYNWYVLFNEPLFWGPILITSLQKLAFMPLQDIYYMEAVVLVICVVLDVPSGALADVIGRKKTIVIGRIFLFGSAFFFTIMTSPLYAWLANILWAIGFTLQSGADTALLYDTLKESGQAGEYKQIEGRAVGRRLVFIAVCSILAGILADVDLRLPLWVGLPFMAIPLCASLCFKEPVRTERYSAEKQLLILKEGIVFVMRSAQVRWMVVFAALLGTTSKVWFFTYNPYFEVVGLDIAYYGFIFFLLNVVAWLSSHYAYDIEHRLGERRCVLGMVLCLAVPILFMGLLPILPFAYLVLVQNAVRGFMRPFVGDYMNRHIATDIRATALSVQSSISNLAAILGLAVFGLLLELITLLPALVVLGLASLALGSMSYRTYRKRIE